MTIGSMDLQGLIGRASVTERVQPTETHQARQDLVNDQVNKDQAQAKKTIAESDDSTEANKVQDKQAEDQTKKKKKKNAEPTDEDSQDEDEEATDDESGDSGHLLDLNA